VIGAATKLSRSEAVSHIANGGVSVNFCEVSEPSKKLSEGDVVSVRHHGRFVLNEILGETKKGRLSIELKKYI